MQIELNAELGNEQKHPHTHIQIGTKIQKHIYAHFYLFMICTKSNLFSLEKVVVIVKITNSSSSSISSSIGSNL